MAINKKLITFATRDNFDIRLANNEINNTSVVFIEDTGELWTHGQFFCTTATNLLEAPILTTSGDTIAVQIGDKISNYIVPPTAQKGRTMYECVTNISDTRGHWTGTIPGVTELYDGLVIHVRFTTNYYGNSEGYNTLNINNLGPKLIWYRQSNLMTSHWGTNAELTLTYRTGAGSYKVSNANGELTNGTTYTDGWVADYAYFANDVGYYHRRIYPNIKAGPNKIFPYTLIMQLPDGRWESIVTSNSTGTSKARNTSGFLLGHVLAMYANATYNENANVATYNIWSAHSGLIDHRYSFNTANNATNGTTGYKPIYLVGTVTDGLFYLDPIWWTQTLPSTEDNKVYIYIGDAYDYYRMTFTEDKPIYIYKNGKIQLYSQYASETEWANITGKPLTFTPSSHTHAYTDLTGSTTTANQAIVSNGTANGWTLKTLGSHAFDSTDYVTIATAQTITGTKTFNVGKWKLAGSESNEIVDKQWGNSTYYKTDDSAVISSLSSITRALRFRWYNDYYDIGVVRGPSQASAGFGIGIENSDNTHVLDLFRVSTSGAYVLGNTVYHSGNLPNTIDYASNVGSSGTVGTNYVTAAKVIAACNWYDAVTGSDTDSVINRWDEIVSFVSGFAETPDLATYLTNNYLAKTGNSTSSPMTGTIYVKDVNPLVLQATNLDLDIWRVSGNTTAWDNNHGFYLRYNGTGQGDNNTLSLWANNVTGTDKEVYRVQQSGVLKFLQTPNVNGTNVSLEGHTHTGLSIASSGYLYQNSTTQTTGTVTTTSGKVGIPIQFYGSQVNYSLREDLFYGTVTSNALSNLYLGDGIKSTNFVETSAHVPTGVASGSSSSSGSGESITYTAGEGIKIAGTQISTNTWTGTESQFAELANPSSYDLIYIIED